MSNIANIALTAIRAFDEKMFIIANNIVNVNTDGFKKSRAVIEEKEISGVSTSSEQVNTAGDIVTIEGVTQGVRETSNVTLEEELTALMTNKTNYEANLKTVTATDELQGTLFDILA
jgi:flagellar basal body rod protein FlgG